jgi:L-alanine-DL-glutamate epimerase-like enolase superfamily enzyme
MNRKAFLQKSVISGMVMGYSGMVTAKSFNSPKEAYSRPSNLKITDIRGATLAAIYDFPIIKIYTNQGIIGLGEVRDAGWISQALMMKPYLIGKDPLDIEAILMSIRHLTGTGRYAGGYAAIDIALMDIAGKALGVPCWKLLGDKVRDRVEIYADCPTVLKVENLKLMMKRRFDLGLKHYKIDLTPALLRGIEGTIVNNVPSRKGLETWGEHVKVARDIVGYNVRLGADHFGNMTVDSGIELGNFMADPKYDLAYIEDVIHYLNFNAVNLNRQITQGSKTPTLNGEDIFSLENFKPWIEQNTVDIIHPDLLTSGGMIETKKIADYAFQYGVRTMMHCASSPIGVMANVHTAATIKEFISLESHTIEMPWVNDLVSGIPKPIIKDGVIPVPDSPGLGIEFNDEVAEKYLREPKYLVYNPGLFSPTPEFDEKMTMIEAKEKRLIGGYHQSGGPWWHINDDGVYANQGGSN